MLPTTFARLASRAAQASPLKTQVRASFTLGPAICDTKSATSDLFLFAHRKHASDHELIPRPPGSRLNPPPPPCPRRPSSPRRSLPPDPSLGTDTCTDCPRFSRRPAPTPRTRVCIRPHTPGRTRDRSRPLTMLRSDEDTRVSWDRARVSGDMGGKARTTVRAGCEQIGHGLLYRFEAG
jgi:hypothetical protein